MPYPHRIMHISQREKILNNEVNIECKEYSSSLERSLYEIYAVSKEARTKGLDPKLFPEIKIANDLAELVEGVIGLPSLAKRVRELSEKMSRENAAFKIAEEIVYGKFGHLSEEETPAQAIRTALAILTEGVTAAVYSEGIAKVLIKHNLDGTKYLAVYFAGPISSAGGTEKALTSVIADFVRRLLGLDRYKPTEEEIGRFVEELRLYERMVGRFQYRVSDEELRRALQYLPVEITGTPSVRIEVSSYRNLPRIETNCLRGGALSVVNDGIVGRAAKLLAVVENLGIQGWDWLRDIREISIKKKSGFMEDVPAGRPILSFPSRRGGFRLRYGRSRNTGLAAVGVHPLTMLTLQSFLAGGTQLKIETPGKSGVVLPVDTIEPPIVRLKDGSVMRVSSENFYQIEDKIDKILFLGDLLVSFGDFIYNNKNLLPSGYTEEWWCEEALAAITLDFGGDVEGAAAKAGVSAISLKDYLKDPFKDKPEVQEAIRLSQSLEIPLYPLYTFFWSNISPQELQKLRSWLLTSEIKVEKERITRIRGIVVEPIKSLLERIRIPHRVFRSEVFIEGSDAHAFAFTLGLNNPKNMIITDKSTLENLVRLSGLVVRDKAPSFVGARVGRPEKAKRREMKPVVQVLFPVGLNGGVRRDLMKAYKKGLVQAEITKRVCPECKASTFRILCPNCGLETVLELICPKCGKSLDKNTCLLCKVDARSFKSQSIPLRALIDKARNKIGVTPKQIKGVKGLINRTKIPEIIEKGVLRGKYNLSVYKDGTVRFDSTNAPLTHFTPSEISVSLEGLRELRYRYDYMGNVLVNPDQKCELKVQDIVIPWRSANYLVRVANFVDDLLKKVYGLPSFYNVSRPEDLIGHLVVGLAPHTCAGVIGRIIGFTKLRVCLAHPFWHSAKRRDCDGDEDSIMLALDAFLNFSKEYLPDQIGGIMDAPLFIIQSINPQEVQRQAHELDVAWKYPLAFYENTSIRTASREIIDLIDITKHRFGSEAQLQGFGFTIPTSNINAGNDESIYKALGRMTDKLKAQLKLAEKIEAVDARRVAEIVLTSHFMRDILGNLRAFTTQSFRCKNCNKRFRRIPLKRQCTECDGELMLTVHRGGIEKYIEAARKLVQKYGLNKYYDQRLSLVEAEIVSLFESGKDNRQTHLSNYMGP
jgi:DNA polymerase II large subunit